MNIICNSALTRSEDSWPLATPTHVIMLSALDVIRAQFKPKASVIVDASWEAIDHLQSEAWKQGRREYEWFRKCYELREVENPVRSDIGLGEWLERVPDTQGYHDAIYEDAAIFDPMNPENRTVLRFRRHAYFSFTP